MNGSQEDPKPTFEVYADETQTRSPNAPQSNASQTSSKSSTAKNSSAAAKPNSVLLSQVLSETLMRQDQDPQKLITVLKDRFCNQGKLELDREHCGHIISVVLSQRLGDSAAELPEALREEVTEVLWENPDSRLRINRLWQAITGNNASSSSDQDAEPTKTMSRVNDQNTEAESQNSDGANPSEPPGPDTLIDLGQGLVRSLALKIHRGLPVPVDLDDLIAYGQLGLAEAAQAFDPQAGVKFTTFAYYRVRGAIYDGVSKMTWTSRARLRRFRFQQMANDVLENEQGDEEKQSPSVGDDASWLGRVTERLTVVFLATGQDDDSISQSMSEAVDTAEPPGKAIANLELQQRLRKVVGELAPDASRLIQLIYFDGFTLTQAADRIGVSKSWASRLHAKSLDQMAAILRASGDN